LVRAFKRFRSVCAVYRERYLITGAGINSKLVIERLWPTVLPSFVNNNAIFNTTVDDREYLSALRCGCTFFIDDLAVEVYRLSRGVLLCADDTSTGNTGEKHQRYHQ
jgi:hypothetical protein